MTDVTDLAPRHPKRFVNEDPSRVVKDALDGLVAVNARTLTRFQYVDGTKVVLRKDWKKEKVAVISGGGAGHEPAHAGFVGKGLLTAAVSGEVFASPTVDAVLATIVAVTGPKGCLLIVKNYTGDRLNFGLAAERAKSEYGLRVRMVIVADDIALESRGASDPHRPADATSATSASNQQGGGKFSRARGIAGTLLVHKVAGAAAEDGAMLDNVFTEASQMALAVKSMGASLSTCTQPFSAEGRSLGDNKMELGLGIHGEAGARKHDVQPVSEVVSHVLDEILPFVEDCPEESSEETTEYTTAASEYNVTGSSLPGGEEAGGALSSSNPVAVGATSKKNLIVLINNLGSVPSLEMQIVACEVLKCLGRRPVHVIGPFLGMTSLDMNGFSISLAAVDASLLGRLDASCGSRTAWPGMASGSCIYFQETDLPAEFVAKENEAEQDLTTAPALPADQAEADAAAARCKLATTTLQSACSALIAEKDTLNEMDSLVGDGDTGTQMALGGQAILDSLAAGTLRTSSYQSLCDNLSRILRRNMGGSSGILLSMLFASMAGGFREQPGDIMGALQRGVRTISEVGGAAVGDRTMLDALIPASKVNDFDELFVVAKNGAESTKTMPVARAGRSQYVPEEELAGNMDPGAYAVSVVFQAIQESRLVEG
ncbi:unnamed protein product [Amoebophrya sp. A25]|nr:unnamed protein product [Amoebophrya sp. A25]|eukprot:GSA25T00007676001.1